jgi:hypothetical protein
VKRALQIWTRLKTPERRNGKTDNEKNCALVFYGASTFDPAASFPDRFRNAKLNWAESAILNADNALSRKETGVQFKCLW